MTGSLQRRVRAILKAPLVAYVLAQDRRHAARCPHALAVCAIFRQEAPFLGEWIDFHLGVGVTQFYLYNNFSTDDFRKALAPYIRDGVVTLTDWPVPVGQKAAYRHCLRQHKRDARWIALIDVDEFLFSPTAVDIRPILERFEAAPGIHVWQAFFGSSGHAERPPVPIVEAFTMRAPLSQTTAKSIVNPRLVYRPDVHVSKYWRGESIDTAGRILADRSEPVFDLLRINHYWSRSLRDLEDKIARGDASTAVKRDRERHLAMERTMNVEQDESILPVSRAVRPAR